VIRAEDFATLRETKAGIRVTNSMNMNKPVRIMAILLLACGATAGIAVAQEQILKETARTTEEVKAPDANARSDFHDRYPRYKLEPGDSFDVSFELNPEFNQTVSVQPDGFVSLRGVGDMQVKGQTVPEVTETIRTAYSKFLNAPLVSIVLKEFEKPYFIADGQVKNPGKYELRGDMSLTEAIAMAGGFLDTSKHSRVLLFRRASPGWYAAETFDVKKWEKTGNLKEDPQLHAGDMLFVPKNTLSKIKTFIPQSSVGAFVPLTIP